MAVDYGEDFLQRITGVHWRSSAAPTGAIFVLGQSSGNKVYCIKFKNLLDDFPVVTVAKLPESDQEAGAGWDPEAGNPIFFTTGSSAISTPKGVVFLLCGERTESVRDEFNRALNTDRSLIYMSRDGLSWQQVYNEEVSSDDNYASGDGLYYQNWALRNTALVWQPSSRSFYHIQYKSFNVPDVHPPLYKLTEEVHRSSLGTDWGQVYSVVIADDPFAPALDSTYRTPFLAYCSHHSQCLDMYGQPVPDGIMFQDGGAGVTVFPASPPAYRYWELGSIDYEPTGTDIQYINDLILKQTTVMSPISHTTCIGGVGDLWVVGGYDSDSADESGTAFYSLDRGQHWKALTTTSRGVITLTVAATFTG